MTASEFWRILARNWKTSGIVFVVCVLGAAVLGFTSPPLYRATALFQIAIPTAGGLFEIPTGSRSFVPSLDVSALQGWLGQADVLQRIIDTADLHGELTIGQLQPNLGVVAAGGVNTFQTSAASFSPGQAQKLADATATVLGERAVAVLQAGIPQILEGLRRAIARSQVRVQAEREAARRGDASDDFARLRYQAAAMVYRKLQASLMSLQLLRSQEAVQMKFLSPAGLPAAPATPGRGLYILFGLVAGVIFGVTGALVHEAMRGAD
jgi:uncharacterized protein involved in exopolysaccharide biosynthesis